MGLGNGLCWTRTHHLEVSLSFYLRQIGSPPPSPAVSSHRCHSASENGQPGPLSLPSSHQPPPFSAAIAVRNRHPHLGQPQPLSNCRLRHSQAPYTSPSTPRLIYRRFDLDLAVNFPSLSPRVLAQHHDPNISFHAAAALSCASLYPYFSRHRSFLHRLILTCTPPSLFRFPPFPSTYLSILYVKCNR